MTEPTRDALQAETLAYLEFQAADKLRVDANRTAMGMVPTDAWRKDAAMYAHAAACVREVAALRARPALPADVFRWWAVVRDSDDKVVELLKDEAEANARAQGWMNHTGAGYSAFPVLAHLTRQEG